MHQECDGVVMDKGTNANKNINMNCALPALLKRASSNINKIDLSMLLLVTTPVLAFLKFLSIMINILLGCFF